MVCMGQPIENPTKSHFVMRHTRCAVPLTQCCASHLLLCTHHLRSRMRRGAHTAGRTRTERGRTDMPPLSTTSMATPGATWLACQTWLWGRSESHIDVSCSAVCTCGRVGAIPTYRTIVLIGVAWALAGVSKAHAMCPPNMSCRLQYHCTLLDAP